MSTKVTKVVESQTETVEINTALLTADGKNGSGAPASGTVTVEVVDNDAGRDTLSIASQKLARANDRMSKELNSPSKTRKVFTGLVHLLCVSFPYIAILLGALNIDDCPAQRMIPIHLIVAGVVTALLHVSTSVDMARGLSYLNTGEREKPAILSFISLFLFVWMILGCVWTFGVYWPDYDIWAPFGLGRGYGYCNYTLYWFAFWFNIVALASTLLGWIMCCFWCSLLCNISILTCWCVSKYNKKHEAPSTPTKV